MDDKLSKPGLPRRKVIDTYEEAHAAVAEHIVVLRHARYALGFVLLIIRDRKLYLERDIKSFSAYLTTLKGVSRRSLYRYVSLAERVAEDVALRYDPEMIARASELIAPKDGDRLILTLKVLDNLKVEVERDGKLLEVPFGSATDDEIDAAIARRQPAIVLTPEVRKIDTRLKKKFGKGSTQIAEVERRQRRGRPGFNIWVADDRTDEFLELMK